MFCRNCGQKISENDKFCQNCGCSINFDPSPSSNKIYCPNCKSDNINIELEEITSKGKTKKTGNSFAQKAGHKIVRGTFGLCTLGISNLFIPKDLKGHEKTVVKNKLEKYCICQNCGYNWKIK